MSSHLASEVDLATIRRRRQRSQSSPEHHSQYPPSDYPYMAGPVSNNTSSDSSLQLQQLPIESGSSTESTVTVKRREANRLAAQRFRSRKKGYQDSLEDRIRVLEEEKDELLRRLGEPPERPTPNLNNSTSVVPPIGAGREEPDIEARFTALEAANRRLRDEVRGVYEENDRLREELEGWRRWHHERPRALPSIDLPPFQPPLERARSFTAPLSSEVVLPPLRLPPLSPAISDTRSSIAPAGSAPPPPSPFPPPSPSSLLVSAFPSESSPARPIKPPIG